MAIILPELKQEIPTGPKDYSGPAVDGFRSGREESIYKPAQAAHWREYLKKNSFRMVMSSLFLFEK